MGVSQHPDSRLCWQCCVALGEAPGSMGQLPQPASGHSCFCLSCQAQGHRQLPAAVGMGALMVPVTHLYLPEACCTPSPSAVLL